MAKKGVIATSRTTVSSAIANTETQVLGYTAPANFLKVGSIIDIDAYGVLNSTSSAATSQHRVRIGTTTLTGAVVATSAFAGAGGTARTNAPFLINAQVTILATGTSGNALGQVVANLAHATGLGSATSMLTAAVTINTTVSNIIELTTISGGSATNWTYHSVLTRIETT